MQGLKATLRHRASDEDDEDSADEFDLEEDENVDAYLINPFLGKTQEEMDVLIMSFLDKTQMPIELHADFKKGAFLAQDRHAFKRSRNDSLSLGADEVAALKQEQRQKWNHPRTLWALVMCCSVGAAVQGMDEVCRVAVRAHIIAVNDLPRQRSMLVGTPPASQLHKTDIDPYPSSTLLPKSVSCRVAGAHLGNWVDERSTLPMLCFPRLLVRLVDRAICSKFWSVTSCLGLRGR